ncbi:MAG: hypothetical protein AAFY59_18980 [Pseudomonadota bacterium]
MNILIGTVLLGALALWVWRRLETAEARRKALVATRATLIYTLPRVVIALVGASFFAELMPEEIIERFFGAESGLSAIGLATLLGILTPGGAFVSFAIAAAALKAGAAAPAILTYVTAWALFSITKIMAEEMAFLGPRLILVRLSVSWPRAVT